MTERTRPATSWRAMLAVTGKELLLLRRDRAGLLVLFLMPLILVVILTLVQENILELTGQKKSRILVLDQDQGLLGERLRQLTSRGTLELITWQDRAHGQETLAQAVRRGDYPAGLIIPAGSSRCLEAGESLTLKEHPQAISLFFDPGIMPGLRTGITAQLQQALHTGALTIRLATMERMLARTGLPLPETLLRKDLMSPPALMIVDETSCLQAAGNWTGYSPVQQNVPAWALFGIFFTAIAIGGSILRERQSGIWIRLASLPVSPLSLFTGKILAYVLVCLAQFCAVSLAGLWLFPLLGLPAFTISANPSGVFLVIFSASLAACSYGVLLGMACNSYEQTSTLGATTVVAASALGGVMVPPHVMPELMQKISRLSPLNWGLTACNDLLSRHYSLAAAAGEVLLLLGFATACLLLSWFLARTT